jgi:hypothetical protein
MFTETLKDHEDVIGIALERKLTQTDMKRIHALLHERLASSDHPGLVIDLTGFEGYEGVGAIRIDAETELAHRNDFARIAVVGERKWAEWGTTFADTLTRAEMRWFDSSEAAAAEDWARQG